MKGMNLIFLIGICPSVAFIVLCAPFHIKSQLKLIDQSHKQMPDWIHKPYREENDVIYVMGERTGASGQGEGETDARMQAARKLMEVHFGLRGYSQYQRLKNVFETEYRDNLKLKTSGEVWGIKEEDVAWKKYELLTIDGVKYWWDVWVRLAVGKKELEQAAERTLEKIDFVINQAKVYAGEAADLLDRGEVAAALFTIGIARSHLEEIGEDPETFTLKMNINSMVQEIASRLRLNRVTEKIEDCRIGEGLEQSLQIMVDYEGRPVANLPITFKFLEGEGFIDELVYTDTSGVASAHIAKLQSAGNPNIVEARIAHNVLNLEEFPTQRIHFSFGSLAPLDRERSEMREYGSQPVRSGWGETKTAQVEPQAMDLSPLHGKALEIRCLFNPVFLKGERSVEFNVMVEILAPGPIEVERPPMNIAAVIDKSGSMGQENKLEFAKEALYFLTDNLTSQDYLSIISYDNKVRVLRPSSGVKDRWFSKHLVEDVSSGQTTNLSGGLMEGYAQVKRSYMDVAVNRVILLSDGLANTGITEPEEIFNIVNQNLSEGVSTTTIGVGTSFDANLLMGISEYGGGKYYFVGDPEDIPRFFKEELQSLLSVVAQNITLRVESHPDMDIQRIYGNHDLTDSKDITLTLGDMSFGEHRILIFRLAPVNHLMQMRKGLDLFSFTLQYDDLLEKGKRVTETGTIKIPENQKRGRGVSGVNPRVDYFYKIAEAFSSLLEYHRLHNKRSFLLSKEFYYRDFDKFVDYSHTVGDSCLLSILNSFEECFKMCQAHLDRRIKAPHREISVDLLRRETEYYNYLLFYHVD